MNKELEEIARKHVWFTDPDTLYGVLAALREVVEYIANWYDNEGWKLDEDDVPDAIRKLLEK